MSPPVVRSVRRERDPVSQDPVSEESPADEEEQLAGALADLHLGTGEERRRALHTVCRLARAGSERLWSEHFR